MKICKRMCKTCPFREGSPYEDLVGHLQVRSMKEARICHSTGGPNAINENGTGKPAKICRGSRDLQLRIFHCMGFIKEPTDEAWIEKCKEMGIKPDTQKDNND